MSANNQILVKEYEGKWYVFECMAESWGYNDETGKPAPNYLPVTEAESVHNTETEALKAAEKLPYYTEYGTSDHLIKDGADVIVFTPTNSKEASTKGGEKTDE